MGSMEEMIEVLLPSVKYYEYFELDTISYIAHNKREETFLKREVK